MKRLLMYGGALILLVILAVLIFTQNKKSQSQAVTPCTQEAKQCPDGSYVSRTGLQCQFADCPTTSQPKDEVKPPATDVVADKTITTLNKTITTGGVKITPLEVTEDSRCPIGVNCIWKGVVRVKVKLENGAVTQVSELSLSNSVIITDKKVSLLTVNPQAYSNLIINKDDYVFEFSVANKTVTQATNGTLSGTMTIGPICPVERVDNPCKPTPQMFAEKKVNVYKDDRKTLVTILTPDANGKFLASLPAGIYYVDLATPLMRPVTVSGAPVTVTLQKNAIFHVDINIDTGIR